MVDSASSAPGLSGARFEGLDNDSNRVFGNAREPPDAQVAVGPNYVVEMVNLVGRVYTKSGVAVETCRLRDFFRVPTEFFVPPNLGAEADPKVLYDALSGRWVAAYLSFVDRPSGQQNEGRLHIAVSTTNDPLGTWNTYYIPYVDVFPDYPGIGVTGDKVTISYNLFEIERTFFFAGEQTVVLEKAHLLSGLSSAPFAFAVRTDRFTVRPAQSQTPINDQFLVTRKVNTLTSMTLIRVTGTPAAGNVIEASAEDRTIQTHTDPPQNMLQGPNDTPFTEGGIQIDRRLVDATWREGRLWTAGTTRCTHPPDPASRACLHLIEVTTADIIVTQDLIFGAPGDYYIFPAVRTDRSGNLYVSFSRTNGSIFPEARVAGLRFGDPPTELDSILTRAGDTSYCVECSRWGDYLGAAFDPIFPDCVWLVGEYSKNIATQNWGTYMTSASYSAGCDSDNDGWSDRAEVTIGTSPTGACGASAWPPDIDSDTFVDVIGDISPLAGQFGNGVPPAPARYDIAPDPPDGFIDVIGDISSMSGLFGRSCAGAGGPSGPMGPASGGGSPKVSMDMVTTGNTYSGATNSMVVGPINNCLTSISGNNAAHNHTAHLVVQDIHDIVGWQARLNYDGGKMRPLSVNYTPFNDSVLGQNVSFLNLPIDSLTGVHRDTTSATSIPAPAAGAQTAIIGAAYLGSQDAAVSPDTPPKVPPDDASYSASSGGVLAAINLRVEAGQLGQASLGMDADDGSPNAPGSGVVVFTDTGTVTIELSEDALGDGFHGEGVACVPPP